MYPYIIYGLGYNSMVGGIRVLHRLAYEMTLRGYPTYIDMPPQHQNPNWPSAHADPNKIKELAIAGAIAIYPEIVHGNPFGCKTVIRYLLHRPGRFGGPASYPPEDVLILVSRVYGDFGIPEERVLPLTTIDLDIFCDKKLPRSGRCFFVGKGDRLPRIPETRGILEITKGWPPRQQELAQIFQTHELFITYDNATALMNNARLCGCPVVVVSDSGAELSQQELARIEHGTEGIGWGMGEIEKAKATVNSEITRQRFIDQNNLFLERLDKLVEYTQTISKDRNP